jgi:hypothetical protein
MPKGKVNDVWMIARQGKGNWQQLSVTKSPAAGMNVQTKEWCVAAI